MATIYEEIAAAADLGTATARKSGTTVTWPYVPVIQYTPAVGRPHVKQIRALAYATRAEAVAAAEQHIARQRQQLARHLAEPRHRALREQYGLPRELDT